MTFASDEVRHQFHQLKTDLQVLIHGIWTKMAQQHFLLHIESAGSNEIVIRIHQNPVMGLSTRHLEADDL